MVVMSKPGDDVRETVAGAGMNDGRGQLRIIGGVPTRRANGAVIRLAGAVRCAVIEPFYFGTSRVILYDRHGHARTYAVPAEWQEVRTAFLRYALANGIYAGTSRMR